MKITCFLNKLSKGCFSLLLLAAVAGCAAFPATPTDSRDQESLAPGGPLVGEMQLRFPLSLPGEGKKASHPEEKAR
ncbi:MAG: hypothetical protein AB1491_08830 [Thermodesulfobacteriota bacterium]